MKNFGGMISLKLHGGIPAAKVFMTKTKLFSLAESLGGGRVADVPPDDDDAREHPEGNPRGPRGVDDGLIRLSVWNRGTWPTCVRTSIRGARGGVKSPWGRWKTAAA